MIAGWWAVLILAAVQGLTEFLPISSSGHLSLGHALFDAGEAPVLFDVVLHAGTLVAVIAFYRRDIYTILVDTWRSLRVPGHSFGQRLGLPGPRMILLVVTATIPTGILGLLLKDSVEGAMRAPTAVATMLLVNGALLFSSRWASGGRADADDDLDLTLGLTFQRALLIGVLQGLAVTPGISRSGITIIGAMWLGIAGERAARFSFLLSIPAILGALVLKLGELEGSTADVDLAQLLVGASLAAGVGLASLVLLVRLLRGMKFHHFAWYCWALGIAVWIGW